MLPEHLLLALLEQRDGIVPAVLGKMTIDVAALTTEVQAVVGKLPRVHGGAQPALRTRALGLGAAEQEAERLKDEFTSTEHLLLAIASETAARRRLTGSRHAA